MKIVKAAQLSMLSLALLGCGGSESDDSGNGDTGGGNQNPTKYTVTAVSESGGSITPSSIEVNSGQTATLTLSLNEGYKIDSVTGCGGSLSGTTYTTAAVTANCQVSASFELITYTISTSAGIGGSITPDGLTISHGDHAVLKVIPELGYAVSNVSGCSGALEGDNYVTAPITSDCQVTASFSEMGNGVVVDRYEDNGDGTITDKNTGLMWLRCVYGQTWQDGTCTGDAATVPATTADLLEYDDGNYDDWRIPTIGELRSLVYCSSGEPDYWLGSDNLIMYPATGHIICQGDFTSPTIVENAFPNTPPGTPGYATTGNTYFYVSFADGKISQFTGYLNVRMVRDPN